MPKRLIIVLAALLLSPVFVWVYQWLQVDKVTETATGLYGGIFDDVNAGQQVVRGTPIILPEDHLSHNNFAVEWWYLTANLFDQAGNQYPLQWTLFRFSDFRPKSRWSNGQQFMGHGKISNAQNTWFEERFARGAVGNAGVKLNPSGQFSAFIDDWLWLSDTEDLFPATLSFSVDNLVKAKLRLNTNMSYVSHGDKGYSAKFSDDSHASMYYSQPFINLAGTITLADKEINVSGEGWFDHEWSSRLSDQNTLGWDWFSLHLDDGQKLMLYNVRHRTLADSWFGSLISAQGIKTNLTAADILAKPTSFTPIEGQSLPLNWQLTIPDHQINLSVSMFKPDQMNIGRFSYYEGAVNIKGSHTGVGFIELTGY